MSDKTTNLTKKVDSRKTQNENKDKKNEDSHEQASFGEAGFNVIKEGIGILKSLTNLVSDINTAISKQFDLSDTSFTERPEDNEQPDDMGELLMTMTKKQYEWSSMGILKKLNVIDKTIKNGLVTGLTNLNERFQMGIESLSNTVESTVNTIGNSVGSVFGEGLFSQMISNAITKSFTFVINKVLLKFLAKAMAAFVNKILLGVLTANLPITLIVLGIVAAVGLIVYYAEEIWNAIKWLGHAIDQGIAAVIDVLPYGKNKYVESRKDFAQAAGVSEDDIKEMYGDTVEGRNQAYEDWKRAQTDEDYYLELLDKARKYKQEQIEATPKQESFQLEGSQNIVDDIYGNADLSRAAQEIKELEYPIEDLDLEDEEAMGNNINLSPVSTTTINNTAVNNMGNNVSNSKSFTSLNNPNQYSGFMIQ